MRRRLRWGRPQSGSTTPAWPAISERLERTVSHFNRRRWRSSSRRAGGGRRAGHGAGRRLRVCDARPQARAGAGEPARPGGGGRRPDPVGGGCKELALGAALGGQSGTPGGCSASLTPTFMAVATGKTGKSAHEAVALGFASADDTICSTPRAAAGSPSGGRLLADADWCRRCRRAWVPVAGRPASPWR